MSKLTDNTFALIFNLINFAKSPVFLCFWFRAAMINAAGYVKVSGILS